MTGPISVFEEKEAGATASLFEHRGTEVQNTLGLVGKFHLARQVTEATHL